VAEAGAEIAEVATHSKPKETAKMKATVGARIIDLRSNLHEPVGDGEIIEVSHVDGSPPYLVRWSDDDRPTLIYPGTDARIVHYAHHVVDIL
jgi:hypothetical protein